MQDQGLRKLVLSMDEIREIVDALDEKAVRLTYEHMRSGGKKGGVPENIFNVFKIKHDLEFTLEYPNYQEMLNRGHLK